jgi:hypothetical protein
LNCEPVRAWYQQDNEVKVIQIPERKKLERNYGNGGSVVVVVVDVVEVVVVVAGM